jgi:hypothetical protein
MPICDDIAKKLDYLNHQLSDEECRRFVQHIDSCADCRLEIESLHSVVQALGRLPKQAAPQSLRRRAESLLTDRNVTSIQRNDVRFLRGWGAFAATCLVVVSAATAVFSLALSALGQRLASGIGFKGIATLSGEPEISIFVSTIAVIAVVSIPSVVESLYILFVTPWLTGES